MHIWNCDDKSSSLADLLAIFEVRQPQLSHIEQQLWICFAYVLVIAFDQHLVILDLHF